MKNLLIAGAIIIGGLLFYWLIRIDVARNHTPSKDVGMYLDSIRKTIPDRTVKTGDDKVLFVPSMKVIVVPRTREILDRTTELAIAGDDVGISKQVMDGEAFIVDQNTKVKVIHAGPTTSEVRIMSGQFYGESGYVPNEFIQ